MTKSAPVTLPARSLASTRTRSGTSCGRVDRSRSSRRCWARSWGDARGSSSFRGRRVRRLSGYVRPSHRRCRSKDQQFDEPRHEGHPLTSAPFVAVVLGNGVEVSARPLSPRGPDACMARPMKTLTELSGITMRKAAAAIAEAKRSLPTVEAPVAVEEAAPPAPTDVVSAPTDVASAPAEGEAPAAAPVAAPVASPPAPKGRPAEEPESEAVKAALDAAVAQVTGLSGDRLARLRDAVKVVGRQIEDVRLVRVFGPEEPVPGAKTLNGFQYLVDVAPASMRQTVAPQKEGRGGGRGDRGRSGGGKGAPPTGGFSMDAMKDDRKSQRSGPGGGRGRPGGGKPR
jgi:hypothetical protein